MNKQLPKAESSYLIGHFEHGEFWCAHETYDIHFAHNWIEQRNKAYPNRKVEWVIIENDFTSDEI